MRTFAAASLIAVAHADSRSMFAPAPAYQSAMSYGQMQAADTLAYVQPMETAYMQPMEPVYATEDSDGSLLYATGGMLLVGAVAAGVTRSATKPVAEPDLEAATSAVRVAMLFSSGRSSKPKKGAGKKPAAKGGRKPPARKSAPVVDDDDIFVHEGTNGFQGDELAFVYRAGLAQ
jgi:hypothetical protein